MIPPAVLIKLWYHGVLFCNSLSFSFILLLSSFICAHILRLGGLGFDLLILSHVLCNDFITSELHFPPLAAGLFPELAPNFPPNDSFGEGTVDFANADFSNIQPYGCKNPRGTIASTISGRPGGTYA